MCLAKHDLQGQARQILGRRPLFSLQKPGVNKGLQNAKMTCFTAFIPYVPVLYVILYNYFPPPLSTSRPCSFFTATNRAKLEANERTQSRRPTAARGRGPLSRQQRICLRSDHVRSARILSEFFARRALNTPVPRTGPWRLQQRTGRKRS